MQTELDTINAMLASTGTAPLTSNDTQHPFFIKAQSKLQKVNRQVQSQGWWFNRGVRTLIPNTSGEVILPNNALHADPVDKTDDLVIRGGKMYDLNTGSHIVGRDVKIILVDEVEFRDLPPAAAHYIGSKAIYEFYRDEDGNQPKLGEYRNATADAWVDLKGEHLKNADVNFFRGATAAQMRRGYRARRLPLTDT